MNPGRTKTTKNGAILENLFRVAYILKDYFVYWITGNAFRIYDGNIFRI